MVHGREHTIGLDRPLLLRGDVGRVLHDADHATGGIEDRVVARHQPDLAPALGDSTARTRLELTPVQPLPELPVLPATVFGGINELPVMLTADFVEPIAHRRQEGRIGVEDRAIGCKLDDRKRAIGGSGFRLQFTPPAKRTDGTELGKERGHGALILRGEARCVQFVQDSLARSPDTPGRCPDHRQHDPKCVAGKSEFQFAKSGGVHKTALAMPAHRAGARVATRMGTPWYRRGLARPQWDDRPWTDDVY